MWITGSIQVWVPQLNFAHQDYAQFAAETGLVGWILTPISIALFIMLAFRGLRSRLEQTTGWLQLGATAGVLAILVHSFWDFNLHIPANAAWFAVMAALAIIPGDSASRGFES